MKRHRLLTAHEERCLATRWRKYGDRKALKQLAACNQALAVRYATRFAPYVPHLLDDLVQQACIGVLEAARKFDPDKGRFSTYAQWWMKASCLKFLLDNHGGLSAGHSERWRRVCFGLKRELRQLEVTGQEATDAELAHRLGVPEWQIRCLIEARRPLLPIDAPLSRSDRRTAADVLVLEEEDHDSRIEARQLLRRTFRRLTMQERAVISRRFYGEQTLLAIGEAEGYCRERARQLEASALRKMRDAIDKDEVDAARVRCRARGAVL